MEQAINMFRFKTRTNDDKVKRFCEGRQPKSDFEFLQELDLPNDPDAARVGLAARRAVAAVGEVDPLYIFPGDREYEELALLPVWDSMDYLALLLELEDQLGTKIPDREAESIRVSDFTVFRFAHDTLAAVQRMRESAQPSQKSSTRFWWQFWR